MISKYIKPQLVGISRRWKEGLTRAASALGVLWLLAEITTRPFPQFNTWLSSNTNSYYGVAITFSIAWFLYYTYERRHIRFQIPTIDSYISVVFGDIFDEKSDWIIGVNEFFDSEIGQRVAANSLHGQVITKIFNGDARAFRSAVDTSLQGRDFTPTTRSTPPDRQYSIGTTAVVRNSNFCIYLVAMARTDLETAKATSSVPMLWDALSGALDTANAHGNGRPLSLPLLGNGRSNVNVEPQHLLRLIVLALVDFGRKKGLPKDIRIVLPNACFDALDIREIRRDWRRAP